MLDYVIRLCIKQTAQLGPYWLCRQGAVRERSSTGSAAVLAILLESEMHSWIEAGVQILHPNTCSAMCS